MLTRATTKFKNIITNFNNQHEYLNLEYTINVNNTILINIYFNKKNSLRYNKVLLKHIKFTDNSDINNIIFNIKVTINNIVLCKCNKLPINNHYNICDICNITSYLLN